MGSKLRYTTLLGASSGLLAVIFLLINPQDKPIAYIFVPVLLVWLILYSVARLALLLFIKEPSKLHVVIASVSVSLLVLLFLLSGIGQLTLPDVVLVVSLGAVCAFYFYRSWT